MNALSPAATLAYALFYDTIFFKLQTRFLDHADPEVNNAAWVAERIVGNNLKALRTWARPYITEYHEARIAAGMCPQGCPICDHPELSLDDTAGPEKAT